MHRLVALALACAAALPATAAAHHPAGGGPAAATAGASEAATASPVLGDHGDVLPPAADAALERSARRRALAAPGAVGVTAPADELASAWCGPATAVDDTAHASSTGSRFKVLYATPSDRVGRFDAVADLIQGDAQAISALVASTSGARRTLRFDTGTSCGPRYLDLMDVRLPRTRAEYLAGDVDARVDRLQADLGPVLAGVPGTRNAMVYADWLYGGDGVAGYATFWLDDRPDADNWANRGGLFAFVFGIGTDPGFVSPRRTTVLHEIAHTLGAVQDSAPHATGMGHCTDEYDVLCYADGGPRNAMSWDCGSAADSLFDCGADDYFAPAPAPGSYLATHWNLFDSDFLCTVGECVAAEDDPPAAGEPSEPGTTPPGDPPTSPSDPSDTPPPDPSGTPPSGALGADPSGTPPGADPSGAAPAGDRSGDGQAARSGAPRSTPSRAAASAVRRTRDAVRSALRRRGLRSLRAAFTAPAAGRVSVTVTRRGRAVATASRRVRRGRARLHVRLTAHGRRVARTARRSSLSVRVRFAPTRGAPVTATRRVG